MRTMFVNKGRADTLAARPLGVPKSRVRKLGVLGAGLMGAGVAYAAAQAGIDVVLIDTTTEQAERGQQYSRRALDKAVARGKMNADKAQAVLARIRPCTDFAALAECDFVVEAVFEDRAVKADVTGRAAALMRADAVFGSNTSTLPISGLAAAFTRPDDFIGMHFFSPVERMPLVEIIVGERTSQATLARALDLAEQLRKTPIVVQDGRGFFTSRTIGTFLKEGVAMLQEGVRPALIENAARRAGLPMGPLAILDEVSPELSLKVYDQWVADGVTPAFEPALSVELLSRLVHQLGRRGRAGGAGFYDYPEGGKKKLLWPGLAQLCPPAEHQPEVEELERRFLTIQALEAARCVEEGVVSVADADLGSVLGIGYPSWTGGVMSYIENLGVPQFVRDCERMADAYGLRFTPPKSLVSQCSVRDST